MNPLIWVRIGMAVAVASVGFMLAWYVQGIRINSLKNDVQAEQQKYAAMEQAIVTQQQQETAKHQALNERISNDWNENLLALRKCYESGRCGLRPGAGGMPSGGLSAPSGTVNGTSGDDLPTPARIVRDCAEETLKLIHLQRWIEGVGK